MTEGTLVKARVLLDSANHCTFMTEKLVKQLKFQPQCKELLSESTFGARNVQDVDTYVVDFNLMTEDDSPLLLHANVVHKIIGSIQRGPLQSSDLEFLLLISPKEMANTVPKNLEPTNIDLLIGSDYFCNILSTETVTLLSGLYLVSSKVGYSTNHPQLKRHTRVTCVSHMCAKAKNMRGIKPLVYMHVK